MQNDLNYDDNTIAQILDVKPASLRTVKSRIKGRVKQSFFTSLKETSENGTKKPSAKPGNRVPRVKVLNYLKKVALFFRFERDILADGAQVIGRDAEKRGEVLQGKVMHDAATTT